MNIEQQNLLQPLAQDVLDKLETVSNAAHMWLVDDRKLGPDALTTGTNTAISDAAVRNLAKINQQNQTAYRKLTEEPAISRVMAKDDDGTLHTYYFCRADQGMANIGVLSYLAPIGRLASLPVGDDFVTPDDKSLIVVSKTGLRPTNRAGMWDAYSILQQADVPTITIESLRELLSQAVDTSISEDLLDQILAESAHQLNIIEGMRRSVITKMGLRDQPILDKFQDEIFRLPLNQRVVLLGPPGTGKTTTLIRRLGQKLTRHFLDSDEQRLVEELSQAQKITHEKSWLMFTPTELLKQYLKEAFAREGVAAPDQNIQTWGDHRQELSRQTFGLLKTAAGGGTFVLKKDLTNLRPNAELDPVEWFSDFDSWHRNTYRQELQRAAEVLKQSVRQPVSEMGAKLWAILNQNGNWPSTFSELAAEVPHVQALVAEIKTHTDAKTKAALITQLQRNRNFLQDFANFLESLQQVQDAETEDSDDQDADEDEDTQSPRIGLAAASSKYMEAIRTQAKNAWTKKAISKTSPMSKTIEWLGDRTLPAKELTGIGEQLVLQTNARRFVSPVKRYIDGIPKRYRAFRRDRQEAHVWYAAEKFDRRDIHPLELDVVLLALLRAGNELLARSTVLRNIDSPIWSSLQNILGCYRHQVLVDEATDFSPIQLACMAELAHPRIRSVFACGDFNQRLTTWGVRSPEALSWSLPGIDVREINVTYRQSRQLNDLAHDMIKAVGGTVQNVSLPPEVDNEGVSPVLLENSSSEETISWLAKRICAIEHFVKQLPSTAVFVNSEDEVEPVAEALRAMLAEHNIPVMACREGQAVGQESSVRVFDVQHIKGLEFEAVFFLGVDLLATLQPELFDKYIYVGITRAAAYLGLTCVDKFPHQLASLRPHFVSAWNLSH